MGPILILIILALLLGGGGGYYGYRRGYYGGSGFGGILGLVVVVQARTARRSADQSETNARSLAVGAANDRAAAKRGRQSERRRVDHELA
jgi:hypothetical protein